jgi:hypothetical protein
METEDYQDHAGGDKHEQVAESTDRKVVNKKASSNLHFDIDHALTQDHSIKLV